MAAVTVPERIFPPPAGPSTSGRRRRALIAVVAGWMVVVAGLAVWSVGRDPATVVEQRDIAQALPELQRAAGVVFAAASGPGRAVLLGDLQVSGDCQITPVRAGASAERDVTVFVRAGEARAGVAAIAAALPTSFHVQVTAARGGTELALHADAGDFIGIDGSLDAGDHLLTLRVSSGCRSPVAGNLDRSDPAAGPAPAALGAALAALGASGAGVSSGPPAVHTIACPDGATAGSYTVGGVAAPTDLGRSLHGVASGASLIWSDPTGWAYRAGNDSVMVQPDGKQLWVSATTAC